MRRTWLLAVAAATCVLGSTLLWVSPASATPSLTVTPNTGLKVAALVHVQAAGFPASTQILVCQGIVDRTPGQDPCDPGDTDLTFGTDPTGAFASDIFVDPDIYFPSLGRFVDCTIEHCGVFAGVLGNFASTAVVAPLTFLPGHPDGRIKRRSDGKIFGDNVPLLTYTHTIAPGGYWTYAVQVQNDATAADDITVTGGKPGPLGNVQFFDGYYDVTSYVLGGGLTFTDMAPGEVRTFALRFHVPAGAPEGARIEASVFFTSDTNGTSDTVGTWVVVHTPT